MEKNIEAGQTWLTKGGDVVLITKLNSDKTAWLYKDIVTEKSNACLDDYLIRKLTIEEAKVSAMLNVSKKIDSFLKENANPGCFTKLANDFQSPSPSDYKLNCCECKKKSCCINLMKDIRPNPN